MGTFAAIDILDGRYHGLAEFLIKDGWWSVKRGVAEIRKFFLFLILPPYTLDYWTQIRIHGWI